MKVLLYNELDPKKIPGFPKMRAALEAGDFATADVKKVGPNLYRCRLDIRNRLLFSIYRHNGTSYVLVLEFIANHAYDKSRFLRHGATIDESKLPVVDHGQLEAEELIYLNESNPAFHLLDKVISFDPAQSEVFSLTPPLIVIGSAGSGKTALTLEKMKQAIGDVLYVTHSPFLVKNSRDLYYSRHYDNDSQQVDFFSFQEFLESIAVPAGRECGFADFQRWFNQQRCSRALNDAHKLFEEFKGVLTGTVSGKPCLGRDDYLALGVKQSIFAAAERAEVYRLFEGYLRFLESEKLFDTNMLSFAYNAKATPSYDFVVIDEVQDITAVQLDLIMRTLRHSGEFIICGDSNQIVHPNFFSWSKVKSFFHGQQGKAAPARDLISVLNTNYRNSPEVTEVANRLLKIKSARFGSIDKESNYLVVSNAHNRGNISFLQDRERILLELEKKTRHSTRFAIVVMNEEQKQRARRHFSTPLLFSVQEAKGLEYDNIILFNFVSAEAGRFSEIAEGVSTDDLKVTQLHYARAKDKSDKSLEIFKFHINAFYVAITRAMQNLYLIEAQCDHALLRLMGLHDAQPTLELAEQNSCFEEWREEARKLELQGKKEQAEEIRANILKQKRPDWVVLTSEALKELMRKALLDHDKKAKLALFEHAVLHHDRNTVDALAGDGFAPAMQPEKGLDALLKRYYVDYSFKSYATILRKADQYGVDFRDHFNHTPLMLAARFGKIELAEELCKLGADTDARNNNGLNALQIAFEQSSLDAKYIGRFLTEIYELLAPAEIALHVEGRLIKLPRRLMEYFLLNLMIGAFFPLALKRKSKHHPIGFNADNLLALLEKMDDSILPPHRKKRDYISGMLAKNEVGREERYNRKFLKRTARGQYILNPGISLRLNEEWVPIYDLLPIRSHLTRKELELLLGEEPEPIKPPAPVKAAKKTKPAKPAKVWTAPKKPPAKPKKAPRPKKEPPQSEQLSLDL